MDTLLSSLGLVADIFFMIIKILVGVALALVPVVLIFGLGLGKEQKARNSTYQNLLALFQKTRELCFPSTERQPAVVFTIRWKKPIYDQSGNRKYAQAPEKTFTGTLDSLAKPISDFARQIFIDEATLEEITLDVPDTKSTCLVRGTDPKPNPVKWTKFICLLCATVLTKQYPKFPEKITVFISNSENDICAVYFNEDVSGSISVPDDPEKAAWVFTKALLAYHESSDA